MVLAARDVLRYKSEEMHRCVAEMWQVRITWATSGNIKVWVSDHRSSWFCCVRKWSVVGLLWLFWCTWCRLSPYFYITWWFVSLFHRFMFSVSWSWNCKHISRSLLPSCASCPPNPGWSSEELHSYSGSWGGKKELQLLKNAKHSAWRRAFYSSCS